VAAAIVRARMNAKLIQGKLAERVRTHEENLASLKTGASKRPCEP
jgi:hypothetical protein